MLGVLACLQHPMKKREQLRVPAGVRLLKHRFQLRACCLFGDLKFVRYSFQCNAMRQSCCEARFCIGQTEGEAQNAGMWSTCSLQKRFPVLFTPTRLRLPVRCNERICLRALSTILVET
jgi:hypothetical protein